MPFDPFSVHLPITGAIPEVRENLNKGNTLIVNAPPGAGKSTLLPLALMHEPWLLGKKILMLEPRRLAARSIATRMASLLGEEVGESVGYRIRFENKTSARTTVEVLTEGILTRMLHGDNSLEGTGLVIFDEFHERSIHADVALALCREAQQVLRPDLRIMVMSATLDMPQLTELLKAPAVVSQGRQYPVEIHYGNGVDMYLIPELMARTIVKASKAHEGDILAFFPGEGEIRKCEGLLKNELRGFAIHPLFGQLPFPQQQAAIVPNKSGKRKVVLATSIAETSLTIEGISIVVDCGYGRTSRFDPHSALSRLETVMISQDAADQRAGRAGRLGPGICYRLWTKATQLAPHRTPEILEADLSALVLDMAQWGVVDVNQLTWLAPPPKGAVAQASELLHELNALENGRITAHGKKIHALPCHPRIAHLLLLAKDHGTLVLATDIAAILEERDPLPREAGIDINLRIEALRRHRKENNTGRKLGRIEKVAASYRKLFGIEAHNQAFDPYETGILLAYAYPERIACARPGNNAQFQMANGKLAMAGHRDDLAHEAWLSVAHVDARDGMGKIFMAAPLNPKDLAPLVTEKEVIMWDTRRGGLIATKDLRIGSIVLQSKPLPSPDPAHLLRAISHAIMQEGERLLPFDENVQQWQNRVLGLRKWNPGEEWPDVSTRALLATHEEWLAPYLQEVRTPDDFKKIDLLSVLNGGLGWEKQKLLDRLAPVAIEVPSGSKVKLKYPAPGEPPVLAVRLQEVFGMADTPTVNNGKINVVLHLLSPGFKPVQITSDLKSFWNTTYYEVRKDLKRRYPKHSWPDDPWTAQAVRGVRKRSRG
ncbi:MAG: ATP-dependent helicase HrpB [Cyclobacteriaceae bacterium]|nr:ATP-dependent helicase HrpB [Cyclobacteriaceae bacterium]MCB0498367.1 ATP-dependent helicase HrpB [Cyclobacteriaceae bacterium]MCB9239091.1 ATP-dependent helicase HrpB [Flammeovirgaceae bacterium]MCO5271117.1 ATP-dependent helicase HrpB [Cyclobacteriaceae bacterium]MCW5903447.1 ATP-dependent helicase HrpB [Cyclobacteriaceae bacterium]